VSAYSEQEELEKLKAWWKNYGGALIAGILLGLGLLVGNKYWQQYKEQQRIDASELYEQMLSQVKLKQPQVALETGGKLILEYDATPYAGMAGLIVARLKQESGDSAGAMDTLRRVIANATDEAQIHAARLKLARLQQQTGKIAEALSTIEVHDQAGFEAEYQELKGDLYAAKKQYHEARSAYREALKHLSPGSPYQRILSIKLYDLGPEASQ